MAETAGGKGSSVRSTVARKGAGAIRPERVGEGSIRHTTQPNRMPRNVRGQNRTGLGNPWK